LNNNDKTKPLRKELIYIVLLILVGHRYTQCQNISGVVNSYYKVSAIHSDHIELAGEDLSTLHPGDKVILMQMTGVEVTYNPIANQSYNNFGVNQSAGRYEMFAVKSVNIVSKQVAFTVSLDTFNYSYVENAEKFQLVKIYEADYATVSGTLTATDWNSDKGGVVALVDYKKLTLNANIDVSNKGFLGGNPEPDYSDECRAVHDTFYFPATRLHTAGIKGEGPIKKSWIYTKGPGRVVTGGGGGLGYFAGAGGGSNYGAGGQGGVQKSGCPQSVWWASGGITLRNTNFYGSDRVTMGGGGGSSTQDATHTASKGGDGGGIIILLVDTLERNGTAGIISNGESVGDTATAGGGGGGAGGSILLDVNVYKTSVNVRVRGGNGGKTSLNTGAGGSGSGGLIWYAGSTWPAMIIPDTTRGTRGTCLNSSLYNGGYGTNGWVLGNLHLPLNGFLFNSIDGTDTICAGQQPRMIKGSMPKGGTSSYTYNWLQSTDGNSWVAAQGTGDSLHFYPDTLTQTTYFTREIISGLIKDTAMIIEVFVYPAISGNTLAIRDTLCSGTSPGTLTGGSLSGGNEVYGYQWQSTTNQSAWTDRVQTPSMNENPLTVTTYYRRIVTSAKVCVDISNTDTLTILPSITNNSFARADTAICFGLNGGMVKASHPSGGDGSYSYQWLISTDNSSFTPIGGATNQNYPAGVLTADRYYKRTVFSGEGDVCTHTTATSFKITVYDTLKFNTIHTDSSRYCAGDIPLIFTGTTPGGGNSPNYTYRWVKRIPGENWTVISGQSGVSYTPSTIYEDTMQVRRVVLSGTYDACIDSSAFIQLDVIPYINNDLVSNDSAICEGSVPLPFIESVASGGAGTTEGYGYLWQSKLVSGGSWQPAAGTNNIPSYASGALTDSTQFRRVVTSQICTDNSEYITVTVYETIQDNVIGASTQYTCFNSSKVITGRSIKGGKSGDKRYSWQQSAEGIDWQQADGTYTTQNYATVPLTDTAFYRRIALSGENNQCIDTSSAALIRINPLPSGDIVSSVDTVCSGDELTVNYANLMGNSPWSIITGDQNPWHTESGIVTSSGTFSFPVSVSGHLQMLDLIDDSLCYADVSENTGVIDLTVYEKPVANAGADTEVCGLEATLNAIPTVGSGTWRNDAARFTNPSLPTTNVTASTYDTYHFVWTERNWQCESSDEVKVVFSQQPEIPFAGDDQLLDYQFSTILDGEPPIVGHGYWQSVQGGVQFTDSTLYNTEVEFPFPEIGDYTLVWTVVNGACPALSDEVTITVGDVEIFHGFSPNGDQVNDTFLINLSGLVNCTLQIFDRWGNEVFNTSGVGRLTWGGQNNNKQQVPEGTYFYVFKEVGYKDLTRYGYIELRK
jgi:gliding motility-associated-like protein